MKPKYLHAAAAGVHLGEAAHSLRLAVDALGDLAAEIRAKPLCFDAVNEALARTQVAAAQLDITQRALSRTRGSKRKVRK